MPTGIRIIHYCVRVDGSSLIYLDILTDKRP